MARPRASASRSRRAAGLRPAASAHAGETLRFVVEGTNDDGGGLCPPFNCFPSNFFVDTVTFEARVCL